VRSALAQAARSAGVDLFVLNGLPAEWRGAANPLLLLPHGPAAARAWRADLGPDGDAFVASLMSSESRKKLRHKERRLADIGPVDYAEAATPDEAENVLKVFLAQKKERFAALGLPDPFDDPTVVRFLHDAAVAPLAAGPPAPVSLFTLRVGDRVVAVFGGAIHGGRFSGMFTSFDADPQIAKFSPGDLLLLHLVKTMCARGLSAFDLGAGDAGYKGDYCRIPEPLFHCVLPVTARGRIAAAGFTAAIAAKSAAKRHGAILRPLRRIIGR
jgi:CelD/BcsL family acetyltransferase involved in cellulose biosynthesis